MNSPTKLSWIKILQTVIQGLIAALTALGVSSCSHF